MVAVQDDDGTSRLIRMDLETGESEPLTGLDPDVHWTMPAWSPDGRWVAVSRWRPGGLWDVGLVDPEEGGWIGVTEDRALDMAPSWAPDGTLLWASDRTGINNVMAVEIGRRGPTGPVRQLTHVVTGVSYPATDGEWLYVSRYHADGWRIERTPYAPGSWFSPLDTDPRFALSERAPGDPATPMGGIDMASHLAALGGEARPAADPEPDGDAEGSGEVQAYRALPSLLPRYWAPLYRPADTGGGTTLMSAGIGAFTGGIDLVARHSWNASFLYRWDHGQTDWAVDYTWSGLGSPLLSGVLRQQWDAGGPFGLPVESDTLAVSVEERERAADLYVTFPFRGMRRSARVSAVGSYVRNERRVRDLASGGLVQEDVLRRPDQDLAQLSVSASVSTTRTHGFSVSPEDGIRATARIRSRVDVTVPDSLGGVDGADGGLNDLIARVSGYWAFDGPGYASHVLAARVSGGIAGGPGANAFHFDLGGAAGQAIEGVGTLGAGALFFPLRGYDAGIRSGTRVVSATAEYRFPLGIAHRGFGSFPLHIDRFMGDLFLDVGNAWGPERDAPGYQNPRGAWLASAGAELRVRFTPFWLSGLDLRAGVAVPLVESDGVGFYIRVGPSF